MADGFHDFVRELFAGMGAVDIRRFFGGAGAYVDGVMFALIADDVIYVKADQELKDELAAEGSAPFIWRPKSGRRAGEEVPLGYWRLPEAAMDDPDQASVWGRKALAVARARAALKPGRKTAAKPRRRPPR